MRVLRRCAASLSSDEVVRTRTGLLVTGPRRTLVDCAGLLSGEALVCALDRAAVHLVDEAALARALDGRAGRAGRAGAQRVAKDRRRDRVSERYGWRTERVTWWELRCRRAAFVARITEVAAERRP